MVDRGELTRSIQVPALTIAAWYDIFQGGSLKNYEGMLAKAGNESARKNQKLLVVIGGHAGKGRKIGDLDFGPAAAEFDENDVILLWYDYLFYGVKNRFAGDKPVRIFVMGTNVWRDEDAWPLARAHETKYFLESNGKAAGPAARRGAIDVASAPGKGFGELCLRSDEARADNRRPAMLRLESILPPGPRINARSKRATMC